MDGNNALLASGKGPGHIRHLGSLEFRGDTVSVFTDEQGSWIFPGQISARMGIDAEGQRQNIERQSWSEGWTCVTQAQLPGTAQSRAHFALHERRFPMWIATISAARIPDPQVRAQVVMWQNEFADVLYEYLVNGGVIRPDATTEQIEALHARIQAIRTSEQHVHRRLTDLIAETAADYDSDREEARKFFSSIQNILLFAASGMTAGQLKARRPIVCFKGKKGPTKQDLNTGKNYLTEKELKVLHKLGGVFFDLADIRVMFRDDVTLDLWRNMLNDAIRTAGRPVLSEHRPWMA